MSRRFVDREDEFSAGTPATTAPHLAVIVWRRKLIIAFVVALSLVAGAVIFSKITPTYSSVAKLHVRQAVQRMTVGQPAPTGPSFAISTEFEIIKSTAVLDRALRSPALADLPQIKGQENPVGYLQSVLSVTAGRGEDIILIAAETHDAAEASAIVNGVSEAYTTYNATQQQNSSAEMLKMLQDQKDRREKEFAEIKTKLLELRRDNPGMLTLDESKGNMFMQQLGVMQSSLLDAQMETTDLRIIDQRLKELKNLPGALKAFVASEASRLKLQGDQLFDEADRSRQRLAEQLRELESHYASNHPEVIRVRGLLDAMPVASGDGQFVDAFRVLAAQSLATAELRESNLRADFEKQKGLTLSLNVEEQRLAQLTADGERTETLLDALDTKIKEVDLNGVSGALTVSTLDAAKVNPIPVSPQRNKILGLALVAGLAMGVSLAMVRDLLDQRLRSLEEIEDTLGTRILGTVPTLGKRVHPILAGKTVDTRPISDVAEAYRSIRTSLFVTRAQPVPARTILVTSATSGEGKTTTCSNLAIASAQMGRRVLIVDADCRIPSLHVIFKITDGLERGLTSILTDHATIDEAIRPTGIEKLDILTSGPLSSRPAELLNGAGFQSLLGQLSKRYDHVFIDSPPVLPVADARVLTAVCDMTVLVLRAERSTRKQTMRARDALEGVGGKLLGVVVNDAPRRQAQYGADFGVYQADVEDRAEARAAKAAGKRRAVHRAVPNGGATALIDAPAHDRKDAPLV